MSYAIRLADQLTQHLRALRKSRGLTQAQLGALVGVKQARMAEIEADPGAVSLDQLTKILAALGGTLHLHTAGGVTPSELRGATPTPIGQTKGTAAVPKTTPAKKSSEPSAARSRQRIDTLAAQRKVTVAAEPAPPAYAVIRPKKGVW